jgi:hypothetical protein
MLALICADLNLLASSGLFTCDPPSTPGSITGTLELCQGTSTTYSVEEVDGATSYTWTLPSGWTGTSTSNSIEVTAGSTGGSVSVIANNDCGSSSTVSVNVTVSTSVPGFPIFSGLPNYCSGSQYTIHAIPVSGATSYTWTLPEGWSGSSTSSSITLVAGTSGGNITLTANNACGSSAPRQFMANVVSEPPSAPGTISGSTSVCSGKASAYSIAAVSAASDYTWTLPSGWTGSSTSTSISVTPGTTSGDIKVRANNSCGSSEEQVLSVTVTTTPATPGSITGNTSVCQNSVHTYSVSPVSGATNYTWTLPSGWSGTSTTNSIFVTAGTSGGNITVTANNNGCSSSARTLSVSVFNPPAQPGQITGSTSVCYPFSGTYHVPPVAGASSTIQSYTAPEVAGATSYTWTLPVGWTGASSSNQIEVTVGQSTGQLKVAANNACGTSEDQVLNVTINHVDASVTQTANVLTATTTGATYQWINCANSEPISGATNRTFETTMNGTYAVEITKGNCSATSACYAITILSTNPEESFGSLKLYPNPTVGHLTIQTNETFAGSLFIIIDQFGKEVFAGTLTDKNSSFDIGSLPSGMYFVQIPSIQSEAIRFVKVE